MSKVIFERKDETTVIVIKDKMAAGTIKVYVVRPGNDSFFCPWACEIVSVAYNDSDVRIEWRCQDENIIAILELKPHVVGYVGNFSATGRGHAIIRLVWELPDGERGYPFVPAFMYGHNEGGKSHCAMYPQLNNGHNGGWVKPWVADEWLVRTDRSSHGLTAVITNRLVYAIGGRDVCRYGDGKLAEKNGLGISSTDPHRLSFCLGFGNIPFTYSDIPGRNYVSRPEGYVNLDKGKVSSQFLIFLYDHEGRRSAAARLLREAYYLLHDQVNDAGGIEEAICAIADALVDYGYCRQAHNFYVSIFGDSRILRADLHNFSSSWSGGLRTAYPLLVAGHQIENVRWLRCARDIISNIAVNALSQKTHLFYENYDLTKNQWNTRGWWYGKLENAGHSGYINGQICHYMLLAYLVERDNGKDRQDWLIPAKGVLDHVAMVQGQDGRFGYTYSEEDGSILDGDGFSGCWFTPAFATLYRITGEKRYLDVARKAMDFYRSYVEAFHVYGGPHDIYKSPDEEGILAWIEAARILHEATGDDKFLNDLLMGLDYEFSWKFAYNVINEVEPLKSLNWCSTGGSVTSVNNSHIHPMGSAVSGSMLYAAEITDDPYVRSRLVDTVRWTLTIYLHYDGHYEWGKKGMVNERFCYTDSLLLERFPDGTPASTWFCGHSWASGAVLEGLSGRILDAARMDSKGILEI